MKLKAALASLAALFAAPAMAEVVVIDFDSMVSNVHVLNYFAGGTDSLGNAGPNEGVTFQGFITATGTAASSDPRYAYLNSVTGKGTINFATGFSAFSFAYGAYFPATVSVYSGLNGTGNLLGSATFNGNAMEFAPGSVAFAGIGQSVVVAGKSNYVGIDDVSFTVPPAIPEPQTWAMLLAGLGIAGLAAHRRK